MPENVSLANDYAILQKVYLGRVYSVSKSSVGFSEVCGNNCPRWSVESGHMVVECGVKPAASSLRLKITKKVQFAAIMEDQIMAGKNER